MNIEAVDIHEIHADPANVRQHPERNMAAIKASLARFGQQRPILVDGNGIVRAGNGTLEAARELGWETINVVRTPLQGTEATAYAIADNRTAELADWDETALAETLRALQSEDFDLASVGYDPDELDRLCDSLARDFAGPLEGLADPAGAIDIPPSQVRMVQLFLTVATFPEFDEMVEQLGQEYGTENTTDTVMECLKRATAGSQAIPD